MAVDNFKPTLWEGALLHNFHSVSILSWALDKLKMLSTGEYKADKVRKVRTLLFTGKGKSISTVLFRFVHEKENGKKIRFTMIGQGGSGFALEFASKELTINAEISAIQKLDGFLAKFEEELTEEEAAVLGE